MTQKIFFRDMLVYIITACRYLLLKGTLNYRIPLLGFEFSEYVTFIDRYADYFFDIVIIDGRVRHSCIAHALKNVKKKGALLLDNPDRAYYLASFQNC